MRIKLVGVSLAELESALKYSGLFVESDKDYAEIKAIPAFLASANKTQCGCDAARQLADLKERVGQKVKTLQAQTEEFGHKLTEVAVHLGRHELRNLRYEAERDKRRAYIPQEEKDKRLADIEFWEKMQELHESNQLLKAEVK